MEKISGLKKYIEDNLDKMDSSDGEYIHSPYIEEIINSFTEEESLFFSNEIENWSEEIAYEVADPIIFGKNTFINQDYLYCLIFTKTSRLDESQYLMENLWSCVSALNNEKKSVEFLKKIRTRIIENGHPKIGESLLVKNIDLKISEVKK